MSIGTGAIAQPGSPVDPIIDRPDNGKPGDNIEYEIISFDFEGDSIYFFVD